MKNMIEVRFGQISAGHPFQAFFGIVSNPQPGLGEHQGIIGPVADGNHLIQGDDVVTRDLIEYARFLDGI
jgi:hypothetical protein